MKHPMKKWMICWIPPFQETSVFNPIPQVKLPEQAQSWASELADFCDQQQGDAHKLKASPARRTEDGLKHELTHSPVSSGGFSFIPMFFLVKNLNCCRNLLKFRQGPQKA